MVTQPPLTIQLTINVVGFWWYKEEPNKTKIMYTFETLFNHKSKKQIEHEKEIMFQDFRDLFYNFKQDRYEDDIIYSHNFIVLFDKIEHMCLGENGNPSSVPEMLCSISTGKLKKFNGKDTIFGSDESKYQNSGKWTQDDNNYVFPPLDKGHFRWDRELHTLNNIELKYMQDFVSFLYGFEQ